VGGYEWLHLCGSLTAYTVLIDIDLVARTGGIKVLLHCLGDGPTELAPLVISAFLRIVDSPRTRAYLNLGTDIEACGSCGVQS